MSFFDLSVLSARLIWAHAILFVASPSTRLQIGGVVAFADVAVLRPSEVGLGATGCHCDFRCYLANLHDMRPTRSLCEAGGAGTAVAAVTTAATAATTAIAGTAATTAAAGTATASTAATSTAAAAATGTAVAAVAGTAAFTGTSTAVSVAAWIAATAVALAGRPG